MSGAALEGLLGEVRRRFYAHRPKEFFPERKWCLRAITWPAAWLRGHGFRAEVTEEAYRAVVLEVLDKVRRHGNWRQAGFFPRYLMKAMQDHCRFHAEEILGPLKLLRNRAQLDALVKGASRNAGRADPRRWDLEVAARAHQVAAGGRRPARCAKNQLTLDFG